MQPAPRASLALSAAAASSRARADPRADRPALDPHLAALGEAMLLDHGAGAGLHRLGAGLQDVELAVGAVVLWVAFYFILGALHSYNAPADAWILTGSILATYGMARGWVEFWLVWVAVDVVGVPLLLVAGYYPSAIMYLVYGAFCIVGFVSWLRLERAGRASDQAGVADPVIETVG